MRRIIKSSEAGKQEKGKGQALNPNQEAIDYLLKRIYRLWAVYFGLLIAYALSGYLSLIRNTGSRVMVNQLLFWVCLLTILKQYSYWTGYLALTTEGADK